MHLLTLAAGTVIALAMIVVGLLLEALAWLVVVGIIVLVAVLLAALVRNLYRDRRRASARR